MRAFAVLIIIVLTAVTVPSVLADGSDADYEERAVTIYNSSEDHHDILCRFYDDLPDIPYVMFTDIFYAVFSSALEVVDNGDGTFTMTNENGASALFDTVSDTVSSDSYSEFNVEVTLYYDESWTQKFPVDSLLTETISAPSRTVLDLSAYGFDMRGEHEVWMPLAIASDLLCGSGRYHVVYSGTSMYCFDYRGGWGDDLPPQMVFETLDRIVDNGLRRTADLIEFSYSELCFRMDTFWGNTGRTDFSRMAASVGLDAALEGYSDGSRGVKALLLDEKIYNYTVGLVGLDRLVYDGGHTRLGIIPNWYMQYLFDDQTEYTEEKLSGLSLPDVFDRDTAIERAVQARTAAWGDGNYHVSGDTAVFSIDLFEGASGWDRYYQEGGDYPDDTLGDLLRALDAASADPAVKNFVIDVTLCKGGILGTTMAVLAMITGQEQNYWSVDSLTGARYIHQLQVDVNLDGVYDEKDLCKRYDLNFGILTSRLSYSAGNMFPILAQEMGVTVIGERSGGGCCATTKAAIPEGFTEYMSSYCMFTRSDLDAAAFENGAVPDVPLDVPETDGLPDYSSFYDLERLSTIMNEQYPDGKDIGDIGMVMVLIVIVAISSSIILLRR